jgi:putative ATP-dependent endonuclease of the OLD family
MRLESIEVSNYRSIANVKLEPCGDFNVLIGRNNSGKSNILGSIEAFFASIRPEIINTAPPVGDEIDLFQKEATRQIKIRAIFRPTSDETKQLLKEISEERPQVKTLLEEIRGDARLVMCVAVNSFPKKYAFVQRIELKRNCPPSSEFV